MKTTVDKIILDNKHRNDKLFHSVLTDATAWNKRLRAADQFLFLPPESLAKRAEQYFLRYIEPVQIMLDETTLSEDSKRGFVRDYVSVLIGYEISSTLDEQRKFIDIIKPWQACTLEPYALPLLLYIYAINSMEAGEYLNAFRGEPKEARQLTIHWKDGTVSEEATPSDLTPEQARAAFLTLRTNRIKSGTIPLYAMIYYWLSRGKIARRTTTENSIHIDYLSIMQPGDFIGIDSDVLTDLLSSAATFSGVDFYSVFYYIAKYALNATPDELNTLETPPTFKPDEVVSYAERFGTTQFKHSQQQREEAFKLLGSETPEQLLERKEQIERANDSRVISIPENVALMASHEVYFSKSGGNANMIFPIQRAIDTLSKNNSINQRVTPYLIAKAIHGLTILYYLKNPECINDEFIIKTNISEFSTLAHSRDANEEEKSLLLAALFVLRDLYVVVWRKRGRAAINLLSIPEIGINGELKGEFVLRINAAAMRGHQNFITLGMLKEMKDNSKGKAQHYFMNQIISKSNIEEEKLLSDVFGYDTMIYEATDCTGDETLRPDEVKNKKEYIRKHKSRDLKKLISWFDQYKDKGIIEWWKREPNKKGDYVFRWKRVQPAKSEQKALPE